MQHRFVFAALIIIGLTCAPARADSMFDVDFEGETLGDLSAPLVISGGGWTVSFSRVDALESAAEDALLRLIPGPPIGSGVRGDLSVVDLTGFGSAGTAGFGTRSLSPFGDPTNASATFISIKIIDAPVGEIVTNISWQVGDFIGSDDDFLDISFNTSGGTFGGGDLMSPSVIDGFGITQTSLDLLNPQDKFGITELQINYAGGAEFPMSLFLDNFVFFSIDSAGIDEPTSGLGGGVGVAPGSSGGAPADPVPEPGTLVMIGLACGVFAYRRMRR